MGYFFKRYEMNYITNVFQKMLDEPNRKPSKRWFDKGSDFVID